MTSCIIFYRKIALLTLIIIVFSSCHNNTKVYDESREIVPNPEGYQKDTFIEPIQDSTQVLDSVHKIK